MSIFILISVAILSPLMSGCGGGSQPSAQAKAEAEKEAQAQLEHNLKRQAQQK